MKYVLFCIRDAKGAYGVPFCKVSRGEAEREFTRIARDSQSVISQFPQDFDLYEVGEYSQDTGKLTAYDSPRHMLKAIDVKMPELSQ